ncbi:MAG: glycerophosphodiester phosphodiesterase [Rhodopirellula sp.]|nr:glycerophosphodiester phosphodiesterase [Rhodopirellula sp.]
MIVAHRGASYDAPENTLAAFRLAWEKQADAIEGDFYLTSDNQIACIHDRTTKRVAPGQPELNVAEVTLDELRKLDVGRWKNAKYVGEKIPTLAEVLETVPEGKQIFVEIKCGPEILPVLKQQLAESLLKPGQIVIICFSTDVIAQSRAMMPQYRANWLTSYKQDEKLNRWKPSLDQVLSTLKKTRATGIGTNGNLNVVNQSFADGIRSAGLEFHIWTVNNVDHARQFRSLGADSITTDRPAFIRKGLLQ